MDETIYYVHWDTGTRHHIRGPFDFDGAQKFIAAIKLDYPNAICEIRRPRCAGGAAVMEMG
jgi:hypothetical protein